MRREIVGIGSLVAQEQSWRVVYERCGHGVQFAHHDVQNIDDAARIVKEYLATCEECAQPLPSAPIEDPVRQSLRDFWLDQQLQPWQRGSGLDVGRGLAQMGRQIDPTRLHRL